MVVPSKYVLYARGPLEGEMGIAQGGHSIVKDTGALAR